MPIPTTMTDERKPPYTRIPVSTHWTELRLAAQADSARPDARAAFQAFCGRYRSAVFNVLRARRSQQQAEDLTQQFFLSRFIEREDLKKLDPERGRFRAWLYEALRRFVIDEWRRSTSAKRDHRVEQALDAEPLADFTIQSLDFERYYAQAMVQRTFDALHARWAPKFASRGVSVDQRTLIAWLIDRDYEVIAASLGIRLDHARQTVKRMADQLWQLLEADVAATVSDEACVSSELDELCRILGLQRPNPGAT